MNAARSADGGPVALALWAPAKVNLFLELVGKRPDGFHELRSLFVAVNLFDQLHFVPVSDGSITMTCSDPALTAGPENLVLRAATALRQHSGCKAGATIRLTKRVPMQAGLGGGSSDAATTLVGLNRLWNLGLSVGELMALAASLGSDVAFFLRPPAAWCTGRGEEVSPRRIGGRLHFVLLCPPFGLATADVYRGASVPEKPLDGAAIQAALAAGDVESVGRLLHNQLQQPAERLRPELANWRERLEATKPAGCLMSGSGSTLFALARDLRDARRIERDVLAAGDPGGGVRTMIVRSLVHETAFGPGDRPESHHDPGR